MVWKPLLCGAICLALGCGCALVKYVAPPAGARLSYARGGVIPAVGQAPEAGTYILCAQDTGTSTSSSEMPSPTVLHKGLSLKKGDSYGFERRSDGTVVAVANGQETAIGSVLADTYFWMLQKPGE